MPNPVETLQAPRRPRLRGDLQTTRLEGLSWKPDQSEESLVKIFEHVRNDALHAIEWYIKARRPKRRVAFTARLVAVVLLGVTGILPLLDGIVFTVKPIYISIMIAVAAGVLAFDRILGSSTGWIRYIKTELQLRDALEAFELDWECQRAAWQGNHPSPPQVDAMLQRAKSFAAQVNAIIQEETNTWVEEFQSSIKQIDDSLKARAAAARARAEAERPGALNLVVANGDQCDTGWTVTVDGGAERPFAGKTAALLDLPAGIRVIRVHGLVDGAKKQAEVAATVPAGGTSSTEVTLD